MGMSDAKTSNSSQDVLTTYALGSCIGVALRDPVTGVAGMLHFQLPASSIDPLRATEKPLMFADTGMSHLLKELETLGAKKRRMRVHLAGGGKMLHAKTLLDIGRRNHEAICKVLLDHGMTVDREMIGGSEPMTMQLKVGNGEVSVKCKSRVVTL